MTRTLRATINYLGGMRTRPRYYAQDHSRDNLVLDPREVEIEDRRGGNAPSLAREGFALVPHRTAVADFRNDPQAQPIYTKEIEALVRRETGADRVVVTGKALLRFGERSPDSGKLFNSLPARFIHIDISDPTARAFASQHEKAPVRRFAHYNVWRVLTPPPQDVPLALCDARSLLVGDVTEADAVFDAPGAPEWSFEGLLVRHSPKHRWCWFSNMTRDEALIFKTNDSDPREPHHIAHSAFDEASCPSDAPPRQSVEARAIAYWF